MNQNCSIHSRLDTKMDKHDSVDPIPDTNMGNAYPVDKGYAWIILFGK